MLLSYSWLKEYVSRLPALDAIMERLSLHSVEVEGVRHHGTADHVIAIDNKTMTHRPDLFSHTGIAREIAAVFGVALRYPKLPPLPVDMPKLRVTVADRQACPRYIGVAMDVVVGPSPDFIRKRLHAVGVKSINNVVDITNYVMLEIGEPLHAFDADKVAGNQIVVRHARRGERLKILDHTVKTLDSSMLLIADNKKSLAIAGVMGGEGSGVTDKTERIILEAANFEAIGIRKTSQAVGIRTESALRWEKGISPVCAEHGVRRAIALLQQYAASRVTAFTDVYPKRFQQKPVALSREFLARLSGASIPPRQVVALLESLECDVKTVSRGWRVTPPWFRMDLHIPEDIVEEIVRLYGVQKLSEQQLSGTLEAAPRHEEEFTFTFQLRDMLAAMDVTEVELYSFVGKELLAAAGEDVRGHVEIANPLSEDLRYARRSLLPRMLENVKKNSAFRSSLKIFEIGHVVDARTEERRLGIMVTGTGDDYRSLRGIVEALLAKLHISSNASVTPDTRFENGRVLQMHHGRESIGILGMIHNIAFAECSVVALTKLATRAFTVPPLSPYPALPLDLSIIVPEHVTWQQIENVIRRKGGNDLQDVVLFDIYRGVGIPEGTKSFAIHLVFQSHTETLAMEDIEKWRDTLMQKLHTKFRATLRGQKE